MYDYTAGYSQHNKNEDKEIFVLFIFCEIVSLCIFGQSYSLVQAMRRDTDQAAGVHSYSVLGCGSKPEEALDPLDPKLYWPDPPLSTSLWELSGDWNFLTSEKTNLSI